MTQQSTIAQREREFSLSHKEFKKLTGLVYSLTGIVLGDHKKDMVYGRLARRLRQLGMRSFSQYCDLLDSKNSDEETGYLVNAITTNLTKFYRESHHFESLAEHALKVTRDRSRLSDKTFLVWSAGCSSGEEPYSIASYLLSKVPSLSNWNFKILATDLDTNMLNKGKAGIYKTDALDATDEPYRSILKDHCKIKGDNLEMKDKVKNHIYFKHLNLLHQWPMKKKYDAIFCRNVLIYFDAETKNNLVARYTDQLQVGGMLCLGHSESLQTKPENLHLHGKTTYFKSEA